MEYLVITRTTVSVGDVIKLLRERGDISGQLIRVLSADHQKDAPRLAGDPILIIETTSASASVPSAREAFFGKPVDKPKKLKRGETDLARPA